MRFPALCRFVPSAKWARPSRFHPRHRSPGLSCRYRVLKALVFLPGMTAPQAIPVRRVGALSEASLRFHTAADTLAIRAVPPVAGSGPQKTSASKVNGPLRLVRRTKKRRGRLYCLPLHRKCRRSWLCYYDTINCPINTADNSRIPSRQYHR